MKGVDLITAAARGDGIALQALAREHEAMLTARSRKWRRLFPLSELMQTATIGLWLAARTFDPAKGRSFRKHAEQRVRAELRRAAVTEASDVKLTTKERERGVLITAERYDNFDGPDVLGIDVVASAPALQEDAAAHAELVRELTTAMDRLPPKYRLVVRAKWIEGNGEVDFADIEGFTGKAHAHATHKRAVARLRKVPALRALAKEAA